MNDIGWALLITLVFLILLGSGVAILGVMGFIELVLNLENRVRERTGMGRKDSPLSSSEGGNEGKRYRKPD